MPLLCAGALMGCEDIMSAVDPCAREGACEVDGVSYMVHDVTVDTPFFEDAGRHIVPVGGATIVVNFTVRNRGSEEGSDETVEVCLWTDCLSRTVAALSPGERASGQMQLTIGAERVGDRNLRTTTRWSAHELPFRVERPDLVPTLELIEPEVKVATSLRAVVTVRNQAFVAPAGGSLAELCIGSYTSSCASNLDRLQIATKALAGQEAQTDTVEFPLPTSLLSHPDRPSWWRLLYRANSNGVVTESDTNNNLVNREFHALPNLDVTCNAKPLSVGQSTSGAITPGMCLPYAAQYGKPASVYRITSPADGTGFIVDLAGEFSRVALAVTNSRGTRAYREFYWASEGTFSFQLNQGEYYLMVHDDRSGVHPSYTITLRQ